MSLAHFDPLQPSGGGIISSSTLRNNFNALYQGDMYPLQMVAQDIPDNTIKVASANVNNYYQQVWVDGMNPISFTESNSPAIIAPDTNDRIALLVIDKDSNLEWAYGVQSVTPGVPECPARRLPIAYIYQRTDKSTIYDFSDDNGIDCYIYKDVRPTMNFSTYISGLTVVVAAAAASNYARRKADYVCNGTNDQAEINEAITAISSMGGKVVLTEGWFNIATPILINNNNITIEGCGAEATELRLTAGANCNIINIGNGSTTLAGISIEKVYLRGQASLQASGIGIYVHGGSGKLVSVKILNSKIDDTKNDAVKAEYGNLCTIQNSSVRGQDYGVYLLNCSNCFVLNNIVEGIDISVKLNGSYQCLIKNNIVVANVGGIQVIGGQGTNPNNIISENIVQDQISSAEYGIYIDVSHKNNINGNSIYHSNGNGIKIEGGNYNSVIGNRCYDNAGYGINLISGTSNLVRLNYLTGNASGGFYDDGTTTKKAADITDDNIST